MMNRSFAATVASTLLPGGELANGVDVPCAGRLIDEATMSQWIAHDDAKAAVEAILDEAGGARAFVELPAARRADALRVAEAGHGSAFDKLVTELFKLYYEHPTVLAAFRWRSAPPQPEGHDLKGFNESRFERVAARGPIWRNIV